MSLHINAKEGEIAETILLPGDPLRAKYVAENFLEDAICYNQVRGMLGYTGYYKGNRVSIQGTGMGMGSVSIYVHELITEYNVQNLIRVGTCGAIQKDLTIGEVLLAVSASGDSDSNRLMFGNMHFAATADFDLLLQAHNVAKKLDIPTTEGTIFSTNTFYYDDPDRWKAWIEHGIIGVEMESQMLYTLAKKFDRRALSILTISDNIISGESSSSHDREQSFMNMMKIALELA